MKLLLTEIVEIAMKTRWYREGKVAPVIQERFFYTRIWELPESPCIQGIQPAGV